MCFTFYFIFHYFLILMKDKLIYISKFSNNNSTQYISPSQTLFILMNENVTYRYLNRNTFLITYTNPNFQTGSQTVRILTYLSCKLKFFFFGITPL